MSPLADDVWRPPDPTDGGDSRSRLTAVALGLAMLLIGLLVLGSLAFAGGGASDDCESKAQAQAEIMERYLRSAVPANAITAASRELCDSTAGAIVRLESNVSVVHTVARLPGPPHCTRPALQELTCTVEGYGERPFSVDVYSEDGTTVLIAAADL